MNKPIKTHRFIFSRWMILIPLLGIVGFSESFRVVAQAPEVASPRPSRNDVGWILSTSQFNNSFEAQAYTGNGYIGIRIPAAGMGYLGNLGKVGWPTGTERITSSIAAGLYAKVSDGTFYHEEKQAIAMIPTWSTLTFGDASGMYSPETAYQSSPLRTSVPWHA